MVVQVFFAEIEESLYFPHRLKQAENLASVKVKNASFLLWAESDGALYSRANVESFSITDTRSRGKDLNETHPVIVQGGKIAKFELNKSKMEMYEFERRPEIQVEKRKRPFPRYQPKLNVWNFSVPISYK